MKELELRDLNLADLENPTFLETLAELASCKLPLLKLKDIYYERQHVGIRTMVVTIGDKVVATASIFIETKFIHSGGKVARIEDVAVHAEYKKNGIGKSLVTFLVNVAKDAGCYKVVLNCSPQVVGFYESLSFKKHDYGMRLNLQECVWGL